MATAAACLVPASLSPWMKEEGTPAWRSPAFPRQGLMPSKSRAAGAPAHWGKHYGWEVGERETCGWRSGGGGRGVGVGRYGGLGRGRRVERRERERAPPRGEDARAPLTTRGTHGGHPHPGHPFLPVIPGMSRTTANRWPSGEARKTGGATVIGKRGTGGGGGGVPHLHAPPTPHHRWGSAGKGESWGSPTASYFHSPHCCAPTRASHHAAAWRWGGWPRPTVGAWRGLWSLGAGRRREWL